MVDLVRLLLLIALSIDFSRGMAAWFAKDYCLTPLEPGEVVMGDFAIKSEERKVHVFRYENGTKVELEDTYDPGEIVFAHFDVDDQQLQFVFELGGGGASAIFLDSNAGCDKMMVL